MNETKIDFEQAPHGRMERYDETMTDVPDNIDEILVSLRGAIGEFHVGS